MAEYIQNGGIPPSAPNPHIFPSRLSTTFRAYFCRITYQSHYVLGNKWPGKPPSDRPWHRWNWPLEKTLNCLNLDFRLPFLGIYAGWWAKGALLLLSWDYFGHWASAQMSHFAQEGNFCSSYMPLSLKLLSTHFHILYVQLLRRQKILYQMVSGIFQNQSGRYFFMYVISISYSCSQIFELLHIFSGFVRYLISTYGGPVCPETSTPLRLHDSYAFWT